MNITKHDVISVCVGIICAQFSQQYFNDKLWHVALERSYFSIMSIFILLFVSWVWKFFGKGNENE